MKKIFLLSLAFLVSSCASTIVVEDYTAAYETTKDIREVTCNLNYDERPTVQLANLSVTEELVKQYPELKQRRVGLGITNRLIQNMELTGCFRFVNNSEEVLNQILDNWEISDVGLAKEGTEVTTGEVAVAQYLVYAELYEFSTKEEEVVDRFNTLIENTTIAGYQVRFVNSSREEIFASGKGTASQKGAGFLANPNLSFAQSTVGIATDKSLSSAAAKIVEKAKDRQWIP